MSFRDPTNDPDDIGSVVDDWPFVGNQKECPFCQISTLTVRERSNFIECMKCHRIAEERTNVSLGLQLFLPFHSTLCVISPDMRDKFKFSNTIDDDPYLDDGFITAFSVYRPGSYEFSALAGYSFSGDTANLEKRFEDTIQGVTDSSLSLSAAADLFTLYYVIKDICASLVLDDEVVTKAFRAAQDIIEVTSSRITPSNTKSIAAAGIFTATKDTQSLGVISFASKVQRKEIQRFLSESCTSQRYEEGPAGFVSIYASSLSIPDDITKLARHIANQSTSFSNRRNPSSVSAAAIYLACRLENMPRKQKDICSVARLTEVTLRKVYKELLLNVGSILPENYVPKKSVEELKIERGKYVSTKRGQDKSQTEIFQPTGKSQAQVYPQKLVIYPTTQGSFSPAFFMLPSYPSAQSLSPQATAAQMKVPNIMFPSPVGPSKNPNTNNQNLKPVKKSSKDKTKVIKKEVRK